MRIKIALFFTLIFSILIIAPTVISFVDAEQDISYFLNINEEEESKVKNLKIKQVEFYGDILLNGIQKNKNVRFKSKNYISEYPKITTPPPELMF